LLGTVFVVSAGAWIVPAAAVGVATVMLARRGSAIKVYFNFAQFGFAAAVGVIGVSIAHGGVLGAAVGIAAFSAANFIAVMCVTAIATRRPMREMLGLGTILQIVQSSGNSSVGLLAGWLAVHAPAGLLGLVAPVWLIWNSYHQQVRQAAETKMFAELASGQERLAGPSADTSARVIVSAAARLLDSAAEIVLLTHEVPVLYRFADGEISCVRESPATLSEHWVVRALGSSGVQIGMLDRSPFLTARLGPADAPVAVVRAVRPQSAPVFERRDEMMASILIRQAESWLAMVELTEARDEAVARAEMADAANRVIGDLGTETIPALMQLRESAVRLSRLANTATSRDGVGDIVEELHAAERAVASLLGAIAMAADTALAEEIIQLPTGSSMGEDDWTTTGTLDLEVVDGTP
jgi:hypothetical protein